MTEKTKHTVVALRTKDGADILGYYCGESDKSEMFGDSIILYRPIYVAPLTNIIKGTPLFTYSASLYFRYGSQVVHMPYSNILHHDIASEFFTSYYFETIGDLIAHDDHVAESHIKFYQRRAIKEIMQSTDSILVECTSEFSQ
jgi:hypothetical protein